MKSADFTPAQLATPYSLSSEDELLQIFRWKERHRVTIPKEFKFPMSIQYFLSWTDPSSIFTYLIYKNPNWESPRGLVFRRASRDMGTAGICDWCHSYGGSDQVGMLTIQSTPKTTIGQYLCLNLDCLEKIETQMSIAGKNYETLAAQICGKIARFFEKHVIADIDSKSNNDAPSDR